MRMASVGKEKAEEVRQELFRRDAVRTDFQIIEIGGQVLIPVNEKISDRELLDLGADVADGKPGPRISYHSPFDEIAHQAQIPEDLKDRLPHKWELLGDVLLLRLPVELMPYKTVVAEAYAKALNARTVCLETGGISGVLSHPIRSR